MSIVYPGAAKYVVTATSREMAVDPFYVRGLVRGLVAGLLASGLSRDEALAYVRHNLPLDVDWRRIPNEYRDDLGLTDKRLAD